MAMAADCERMIVHVPIKERTRFKRIMRAMGYEVEKKNAIDRAIRKVSQQKMVEDSLTRAFSELKAGEARPIDELLAEL